MKIAVCLKQVPDTEAEIKWDIPKGALNREGMDPNHELHLMNSLWKKRFLQKRIMMVKLWPLPWGRIRPPMC